jgi:hypothetical protein
MKTITALLLSLTITGTQALAASGAANPEGMSLLATFFLAFGALVILFQFLPGMALFMGMLKGIFSSSSARQGKKAARNGTTL